MISHPYIGEHVQVWYGKKLREIMPLHGKWGIVVKAGKNCPRNHVVNIDGNPHVVPAGNLRHPE